ncbi:hypothetical protein B0H67DRAFT_359513 [Lasiosphaeris hirsuta]|uniref:Protamine P1 n=1 Tax=Lasiosphaeris hirsuta TaxID=260670 RepID=A0AA39ZW84_9PEZI|nr:hypothetical protein B0H67DRAFT_359513 [Lasiosphaeris hirsuta]
MRSNTVTRMEKNAPPPGDRDWLQLEYFANEPIYCEAQHDSDDVLYSGSDDDAYEDPAERRIRCEYQAQRYLKGRPTLLLSASLQGPFDRESGWKNPWLSRSGGRAGSKKRKLLATTDTVAEQRRKRTRPFMGSSCHLLSPESSSAQLTPYEFLSAKTATRIRDWRDNVVDEAEAAVGQCVEHVHVDVTPLTARPGLELAATSSLRQEATDMSYRTRSDRSFRFRAKPLRSKPDRSARGRRDTAPPEFEVSGIMPNEYIDGDVIEDVPTDAPENTTEFVYQIVPKGTFEDQSPPQPEVVMPHEDIFADTHGDITEDDPENIVEDIPGDVPEHAIEVADGHVPKVAFEDMLEDTPGDTSEDTPKPKSTQVLVQPGIHQLKKTPTARATQEDIPRSERPRVSVHPNEHTHEEALVVRGCTARTSSLMDGPTLVPGRSYLGSGGPKNFGIGHFSFENKSPSFTENGLGLPGKLLWPKPQQPTQSVLPSESAIDLAPLLDLALLASAELGNEALVRDEATQSGLEAHGPADAASSSAECDKNTESNESAEFNESMGPEEQDKSPGDQDVPSHLGCPASDLGVQSTQEEGGAEIVYSASCVVAEPPGLAPLSENAGGSQHSPEPQSPWTVETLVMHPKAKPEEFPSIINPTPDQAASQSPWAKGDSQVVMVGKARPYKVMSSPTMSHDLSKAGDSNPAQELMFDMDVQMSNAEPPPLQPSTPKSQELSLPTPEFTLSIKSFREFMTPSPVKIRRISADGQPPGTQRLVDAAVSNPWTRPSTQLSTRRRKLKKSKRVSWAPLPGEEQSLRDHTTPDPFPSSSPAGAEFPIASSAPQLHSRPRACSPPPSSLVATDQLPTANEKFGEHFAAMANRRRRSTTGVGSMDRVALLIGTPRIRKSLLPSASQQVCESPAMEAMAEAFLEADETVARHEECVVKALGDGGVREAMGLDDEEEEEEEDITFGLGLGNGEEPEEEPVVDDVTAVLDNLDDFLDRWDVEVELAKAGTKERERQSGVRLGGGLSQMDVGVWD